MTKEAADNPSIVDSWDAYWAGAESSPAFSGGGTTDPLILDFWKRLFLKTRDENTNPHIVDIASGNGAVVESAARVFEGELPPFTCVDISESAVRMIAKRFPGVTGVVADAGKLPLQSGAFDLATSQFGVEYAGLDAVGPVAELVSPGGRIALLLHHRGGVIREECTVNHAAIQDMQQSKFLPLCSDMLDAAYEALAGGDRTRYQTAGRALAPAIADMEAIMRRYGREVAASTIVRVYRDVRTIHDRIGHYERSSVLGWLDRMTSAIEAYKGRMASMVDSALDEDQFDRVTATLEGIGFTMEKADALRHTNARAPLAWQIVAHRRRSSAI